MFRASANVGDTIPPTAPPSLNMFILKTQGPKMNAHSICVHFNEIRHNANNKASVGCKRIIPIQDLYGAVRKCNCFLQL